MAKYRIIKNTNSKSAGYNKFYAVRHTEGNIGMKSLARRMAARNSSFSEGVMLGVLTDLTELIKELAFMGYTVTIDDLGIFFLSLKSKGVEDVTKFDAQTMITSKWKCMPTGATRTIPLSTTRAGGVEANIWQEDDNYDSPRKGM